MTTNCVFPPELDDKQLLAYLDDPDTHQETARHLEKCSYCREKAQALDGFQKRLTTRLYRITCPSPMELGEYHLRMLPANQNLVVAQHIRDCPHCSQEIAELEGFLHELPSQLSVSDRIQVLIAQLVSGGQADRDHGTFSQAPAFTGLRGWRRASYLSGRRHTDPY